MTDVATGESTTLDAAPAAENGEPVLAWFWAPFCPTCRGEAPELDAFMADNAVAAQPYMILIVDGEEVERWPGGVSVRQIEDALEAYS